MIAFRLPASQAKTINAYKNLRTKVSKCCANIYFNKQCLYKKVTPKYAQVRIPNTSPASQNTAHKARIMRIKDELRFLHKKKETLNKELYKRHLQAAQEWGNLWYTIQNSIQQSINTDMEKKYKVMDEKIKKLTQSQSQKPPNGKQFYPRVVNKTNIIFTDGEMELLNKGLKYNLGKKQKQWVSNLAMEAETAITLLPTGEQDYIRHQVSKNISKLYHQQEHRDTTREIRIRKEDKIIKQIKHKLKNNNASIAKADKGNSTVIVYVDDYNRKVNDFISSNNFTTTNTDITKPLQREIRSTINECKSVIPRNGKWKLINLNPTAPTMKGLIKLHKEGTPIRPVVNWKHAPGYKLAQTLVNTLNTYIPLPYTYNVKNTPQLIDDLTGIPQGQTMKFASFDISNMYSNIPIEEMLTILKNTCDTNGVENSTTQEIMRITKTLVTQNYFQFQNTTYMQNEGLAMGAPTSSILSEIYMQYIESNTIYDALRKHSIEGYFRYVDDILLVYNDSKTDIKEVLKEFNNITPKLRFTLEKEKNNKINFLDITIIKNPEGLTFEIYRKPTTTDLIIPNDSCHPNEHKTAALRYYQKRIETYQLSPENRMKEKETIQQILANNKYDTKQIEKTHKKKEKKDYIQKQKQKQIWAKFTYIGKETRFITKLFKNTNVRVAFTTSNTIGKHLTTEKTPINKYDKSGVYQLTCPDCNMKYTGQTGRPFKVRFQEHLRDFKYNNNKSKFAQHLLENRHAIGNMEDIMEIVHTTTKGKKLDALENFYIYKETIDGNQINEKSTVKGNELFDTIIKHAPQK